MFNFLPPVEYTGPYEQWAFTTGIDYMFPALRDTRIPAAEGALRWPLITAVADWPGGFEAANAPGFIQFPDGRKGWIPTLWEEMRLHFLPLIVEDDDGAALIANGQSVEELASLERAIDTLSRLLSSVSQTLFVDNGEFRAFVRFDARAGVPPGGVLQPTYRLNLPLHVNTMARTEGKLPPPPLPDPWNSNPGFQQDGDPLPVIVAVIDDGIPFAHDAFLDGKGSTRVEYCWLQAAATAAGVHGGPGAHVRFGREYTRKDIDTLRSTHADEDALYRKAGAVSDLPELGRVIERIATHGGHVLDLAAGQTEEARGGGDGFDRARIIAVQLPNTIAWDTSGFGKDMYMLSAFHYIFDRADRIARAHGVDRLPLIVNFSYGFSGGPHDGGATLELAIEEMVRRRHELGGVTDVVMPSGNLFLDRLHGHIEDDAFSLDAEGNHFFDIPWRLQPNDRTPNYLEIWLDPDKDIGDLGFGLIAPSGEEILAGRVFDPPPAMAGDRREILQLVNADDETIGQISADRHRGSRWRVLVVLAATEPERPSLAAVPAGLWTLRAVKQPRLDRILPSVGDGMRVWIQRDTDPAALETGSRQSYLDDPQNPLHDRTGALMQDDDEDAFVRRYGSMNGIATMESVTVVAGLHARRGGPAPYSSAGMKTAAGVAGLPHGRTVDFSAPGDLSETEFGVVASGARSSSWASLDGTSVAAPQIARMLAEAALLPGAGRQPGDGFSLAGSLSDHPHERASVSLRQGKRPKIDPRTSRTHFIG